MTILSDKQLDEIRAREQAATKGPWRAQYGTAPCGEEWFDYWNVQSNREVNAQICELDYCADEGEENTANTEFIAHARQDIPALLDTIAALKKKLEEAKGLVEEATQDVKDNTETRQYGLFPGGDPRLFTPDPDVCSEAEVLRHAAACKDWEAGTGRDRGPSCATMGDGSAWTGEGFGLGVYTWIDSERKEWLKRAAALAKLETP